MAKRKIDWNGPIQIVIVVSIILGANLPFYFMHRADLRAFEKEMRDFNLKLIRIEERRK